MNDNFKGVWIPAELWTCKKLKLIEKLFLTQIKSLDNGEGCTAGNTYFSDFFGITKSRCSQIIKSLEAKKMIKITIERDGKLITKRVCNLLNLGMYYFTHPMKNIKFGYVENAEVNNTKNNNKEEDSFDRRINKQLPFDVVTSSHTINAIFEDPQTAIDELKNIYQIEATPEDIKTAIHTFSTVAIASYDTYKGIRTIEKLTNKFLDWIPKSIKYQATEPKPVKSDNSPEGLSLDEYILTNYRQKDLDHWKRQGDFERWDKELKENSFRLSNVAKAYKNPSISTMLLFELSFMPLSKCLMGSTAQRKLDSFVRLFKSLSDYNQNMGDVRTLIREQHKTLA